MAQSRSARLRALLQNDELTIAPGVRPRTRRAMVEHERIVAAIEDRDADLAEMQMRRHIAAARMRREAALVEV